MIAYGTEIISDIVLPLDLSHFISSPFTVELSSKIPVQCKTKMFCKMASFLCHGRTVTVYGTGEVEEYNLGCCRHIVVHDVLRFYWFDGENIMYYALDEQGDASLLSFWFIHYILPGYLSFEGMYDFFHAGAVQIEGLPVLFIAPSKGGKSTLTDYFIRHGHTHVADDKVPTFIVEGDCMVVGAHPYYRPFRQFEKLGYHAKKFATGSKRIHAAYILEKEQVKGHVIIKEVKGMEKFYRLKENYLFDFPWLCHHRLRYLSDMANSIRAFCVKIPWDLQRLGEVGDAICRHSNAIR